MTSKTDQRIREHYAVDPRDYAALEKHLPAVEYAPREELARLYETNATNARLLDEARAEIDRLRGEDATPKTPLRDAVRKLAADILGKRFETYAIYDVALDDMSELILEALRAATPQARQCVCGAYEESGSVNRGECVCGRYFSDRRRPQGED